MISDGFHPDSPSDMDSHQIALLTGKLTSERARERLEAVAALKARYRESGIPPPLCPLIVCALCARLPLEAGSTSINGTTYSINGTTYSINGTTGITSNTHHRKGAEYAQSKAAAAVRDCKWAVQCAQRAHGGRLDGAVVRAVVRAVCGLVGDAECLGEFVASICNRLVFPPALSGPHGPHTGAINGWAVTHADGVWERVVASVVKAVSGVGGQRRPVVYNEADLLLFLAQMARNMPKYSKQSFLQHAAKLLQLAAMSFRWAAELPDLAVFSAAVDLMLAVFGEARQVGCLLEVARHLGDVGWMWAWVKHRALAQQSGVAELLILLHCNEIDVISPVVQEMLVEELASGKLCSFNVSASDLLAQPPSVHVNLLKLLSMCVPASRLHPLTSTRFPEYRIFQITAASQTTQPSVEWLVEELEKSGRDSQPFLLLGLIRAISTVDEVPVQMVLRVFKCGGVVVLKQECREAALELMLVMLVGHIDGLMADCDLVDQQVRLLLAVMDGKEPNLRFANLLVTYLERRFQFEYWTLTGRRMFEQVATWLYSYNLCSFPFGLVKRFLSLPFARCVCAIEDTSWNHLLQAAIPVTFDADYISMLLNCHGLGVGQCEDLVKLTVRQIANITSTHTGDPSNHTLTIVDSMHHSPHYLPTPEVACLALLHAILVVAPTASALLGDAQKYLCQRIVGLEPYQFKAFVESVACVRLVGEVCGAVVESLLVDPNHQNDPSFTQCALKILADCQAPSRTLVKLVLDGLLTRKVPCSNQHLQVLSKHADPLLLVEFADSPTVDIDLLSALAGDALASKLVGKADSVGTAQFADWCRSGYVMERGGSLFMDIVCARWRAGAESDDVRYFLRRLHPKLARLLPAVIRRLFDIQEMHLDLQELVQREPMLFSPVLVKYLEALPESAITLYDFAIESFQHAYTKRIKMPPNRHMVIAFAISQGTKPTSHLSASDWFLSMCQYCRLFAMLPFDAKPLLLKVMTFRKHMHDFVLDQVLKACLLVDVPEDMKADVVRTVFAVVKEHRITYLPASLPLLILNCARFGGHAGWSCDELFKDHQQLVDVCAKRPLDPTAAVPSKHAELIVQILAHCEDDLFEHIARCFGELLRFSATAKALCDHRANVKLDFQWHVTETEPSTGGLVESMFKSMTTAQCDSLYTFVYWVLSYKQVLAIDGLALVDECFHGFLLSAEPCKLALTPPTPTNAYQPKHLHAALAINTDPQMQAELHYHCFVAMEADSELAQRFLWEYLPSAITDSVVLQAVIVKVIAYCGRSAELLARHHPALRRTYETVEWGGCHLSAAYCFEALRRVGDAQAFVEENVRHFKAVDWGNTLERRVDHVKLLLGGGCARGVVRDGVEMAILGDGWEVEDVPRQLVEPADRLAYSHAKLRVNVDSQKDTFTKMASLARHQRLDTPSFLLWFDTTLSRASEEDKVRLVKTADLVGRLYGDACIRFAGGLLAGKLLRKRGLQCEAVQAVKSLLLDHHHTVEPALLCRGLCKLGKWLEEGKAAVPKDILEHYLEPAYKLAPPNSPYAAKTLYRLAWFLDRQFTDLESSDLVQAKADFIQFTRRQLDSLRGGHKAHKQERNVQLLEAQLAMDQEEYNGLLRDKLGYLVRLLESYLRVLQMSNDKDVVVFRFCSLWFNVHSGDTGGDEEAVNVKIGPVLAAVPSHKFLPVVYQLAAKYQTLSSDCRMHALLTSLLRRLIFKHPHHSVMQFISLSHGAVPPKRTASSLDSPTGARNNARDLLAVTRSTRACADVIKAIEELAAAYVELAELPVDGDVLTRAGSTGIVAIPKHMLIHRIPTATAIPILTLHLEPDPEGNYTNAVTYCSMDPHFRVVGGINLPKVVDVLGSDGKRYRQLVKGRDDLRQDAVVEQVFRLVNRMLNRTDNTPLRCYRVVPLHQRAGVLEWVADAVPLGDYLQGAHSRYGGGWTLSHCRQVARVEAERPGSTLSSKLQLFNDIQSHLQPVFHHFFLERFPTPSAWLTARSNYSTSCATSSMMGYIIGLGDRHCQNILIDCRSGHLCHIDLNMIFEQGRTLRVPERVPFRLTREVVAGMGCGGVEHGFRTAACGFLGRMREHKDNVLMVLEVFKHDPLHHWPAVTAGTNKVQDAFDKLSDLQSPHLYTPSTASTARAPKSRFDMADRALLRVKEKVSGREEGAQISVQAQVEYLVQLAGSEEGLCQMYCGWQPWL